MSQKRCLIQRVAYLVILNLPEDEPVVGTSWDKMNLLTCGNKNISSVKINKKSTQQNTFYSGIYLASIQQFGEGFSDF